MFTFLNTYTAIPHSIEKIDSIGEVHEAIDPDRNVSFVFTVYGLVSCEHHFDTIEAANEERDRFIHWIKVIELENEYKETLKEAKEAVKNSKTNTFWKGQNCETCVFRDAMWCQKFPPLCGRYPNIYLKDILVDGKMKSFFQDACSFWESREVKK